MKEVDSRTDCISDRFCDGRLLLFDSLVYFASRTVFFVFFPNCKAGEGQLIRHTFVAMLFHCFRIFCRFLDSEMAEQVIPPIPHFPYIHPPLKPGLMYSIIYLTDIFFFNIVFVLMKGELSTVVSIAVDARLCNIQ